MGNTGSATTASATSTSSLKPETKLHKRSSSSSSCSGLSCLTSQRKPPLLSNVDFTEDDDDDDDVVVKEGDEEITSSNHSGSSNSSDCGLLFSSSSSAINSKLSHSNSWLSFNGTGETPWNTTSELDYTPAELELSDAEPTEASDLTHARPVYIVTTAALPWMTGTAVNPLLRAAYLSLHYETAVIHLVLPWLDTAADRVTLYGEDWKDSNAEFQEEYILNWIQQHVGSDNNNDETRKLPNVQIHWYPARYHAALGSIFAISDVCAGLENTEENAVCILEEPEHLNYYRGGHWRTKFRHVVGVIHTNYCQYAEQKSTLAVPLIGAVSAWMVRAYCDKVIQLSSTLPAYAPEKEIVCNVHGVRREFFQTYTSSLNDSDDPLPAQIYFLGKLLWAKGLDKLLELQLIYKTATGTYFRIDIYGSGPEQTAIADAFATGRLPSQSSGTGGSGSGGLTTTKTRFWGESKELEAQALPVEFKGRIDHACLDNKRNGCYKIFVNPSVSEVLCTVTAEAIAMGKFVIIPNHPSNKFFKQFRNCLRYDTPDEFVLRLVYALSHEPEPLDSTSREALTWEGATDRLITAASISHRQAARRDRLRRRDQRLANIHIKMGQGRAGDVLRKVLGGGPVAKQTPVSSPSSSNTEPTELSPSASAESDDAFDSSENPDRQECLDGKNSRYLQEIEDGALSSSPSMASLSSRQSDDTTSSQDIPTAAMIPLQF